MINSVHTKIMTATTHLWIMSKLAQFIIVGMFSPQCPPKKEKAFKRNISLPSIPVNVCSNPFLSNHDPGRRDSENTIKIQFLQSSIR